MDGALGKADDWRLGETEDASEHQQAWDFLKTALDEDRLSDRPLLLLTLGDFDDRSPKIGGVLLSEVEV